MADPMRLTLTHRRRDRLAGAAFTLPAVALFAVFFAAPLAYMVWIALNDWPLLGEPEFIGVENFVKILGDDEFWRAAGFTLNFALLLVPMLFLVGLVLALVLQSNGRATTVVRTAVFLPVSLGFAAASYLWLSLLNPQVGVANKFMQDVGLVTSSVNWFDSGIKALLVIVLITVWKFAGFSMVAFINGLNSIPREIEEAAEVDGAGRVRTFFLIKLPLLRQTIAFVLTFLLVTAFLTFDQFYILTAGGPQNSTITLVYRIYNTSFIKNDLGEGAAMSLLFLVFLGILTGVQLFLLRTKKDGAK
jgi:multiple sugar transport system permease protein